MARTNDQGDEVTDDDAQWGYTLYLSSVKPDEVAFSFEEYDAKFYSH